MFSAKVFVSSCCGIVAGALLLVGVAFAADVFTVDKDGTIRFQIVDDGSVAISAGNVSSSTMNVAGAGNPFGDVTVRLDHTGSGQSFAVYNRGVSGQESLRISKVGSSAAITVASGNPGFVGIGTGSPQGALDVSSTTGGFLVPRLTTAQRNALTAANGMIVYNTSTNAFDFYENGAWVIK